MEPFQRKCYILLWIDSLRVYEGIILSLKISSIYGKTSFQAKLYHDIKYY